jgi:DMSO/TMAO reductase YedYZ molybdopterin-dependent catalytic subunit
MLAYAWDGVALAEEHGFPVRLFVPDVYGMKQPKWVVRIDAIDRWEPGYWVQRGWDRDGRVAATSAIDTVRSVGAGADGRRVIEAGGIAYAGARGVSKVEVRIDGEEWRAARLRAPLSDLTWVIWRADMTAARGKRTIAVRCFERDGTPQASGFHSRTIDL